MRLLFLWITLLTTGLIACQDANTARGDDEEGGDEKKNISKRDYSITKANAYSDLFFRQHSHGEVHCRQKTA